MDLLTIPKKFTVRAVPRDVYSRLKALEDRVLQLEKAGALQQREAEMAAATATTVELRPQIEAAVPVRNTVRLARPNASKSFF